MNSSKPECLHKKISTLQVLHETSLKDEEVYEGKSHRISYEVDLFDSENL